MNRNKIKINRDTKISVLLRKYPGLRDDLARHLKGVNMAKTPLLKVMIPSADIKLLARYAKNMNEKEVIELIQHLVTTYERDDPKN